MSFTSGQLLVISMAMMDLLTDTPFFNVRGFCNRHELPCNRHTRTALNKLVALKVLKKERILHGDGRRRDIYSANRTVFQHEFPF